MSVHDLHRTLVLFNKKIINLLGKLNVYSNIWTTYQLNGISFDAQMFTTWIN